jgi:hypothetical protein
VALGDILQLNLCLLGLQVAPTGLLFDLDLLLARFLHALLQLLKLFLLGYHELVDRIVLETQLPEGI